MARYIDADALIAEYDRVHVGAPGGARKLMVDAPTADVVPKSEAEQWYHEYHAIKDELKQEKMYHRATEKLADRYCAELQTAKSEVAREIFEEIEREIKNHGICYAQRKIAELKKKYTEDQT
jgi:hypothetical protein